jgi:hypothetical protein
MLPQHRHRYRRQLAGIHRSKHKPGPVPENILRFPCGSEDAPGLSRSQPQPCTRGRKPHIKITFAIERIVSIMFVLSRTGRSRW